MAATIFRDRGTTPESLAGALRELRTAANEMRGSCPEELIAQLFDAISNLEESVKATVPIKRGAVGQTVGFGISKATKAIACDRVIAAAKQIKAYRSW